MSISVHKDIPNAKRIVVKVGSSSITGDNQGNLVKLVTAVATCIARGQEVVLVTSGAIATGMPLLNMETKPTDLPTSQALAAVGQSRLMVRYQNVLDSFKVIAGQVLLTAADLESEESSANAKAAIERMLELGVLPIVNENDTVATNEIRFGDNDRLAVSHKRHWPPRATFNAHEDIREKSSISNRFKHKYKNLFVKYSCVEETVARW